MIASPTRPWTSLRRLAFIRLPRWTSWSRSTGALQIRSDADPTATPATRSRRCCHEASAVHGTADSLRAWRRRRTPRPGAGAWRPLTGPPAGQTVRSASPRSLQPARLHTAVHAWHPAHRLTGVPPAASAGTTCWSRTLCTGPTCSGGRCRQSRSPNSSAACRWSNRPRGATPLPAAVTVTALRRVGMAAAAAAAAAAATAATGVQGCWMAHSQRRGWRPRLLLPAAGCAMVAAAPAAMPASCWRAQGRPWIGPRCQGLRAWRWRWAWRRRCNNGGCECRCCGRSAALALDPVFSPAQQLLLLLLCAEICKLHAGSALHELAEHRCSLASDSVCPCGQLSWQLCTTGLRSSSVHRGPRQRQQLMRLQQAAHGMCRRCHISRGCPTRGSSPPFDRCRVTSRGPARTAADAPGWRGRRGTPAGRARTTGRGGELG